MFARPPCADALELGHEGRVERHLIEHDVGAGVHQDNGHDDVLGCTRLDLLLGEVLEQSVVHGGSARGEAGHVGVAHRGAHVDDEHGVHALTAQLHLGRRHRSLGVQAVDPP